MKVNVYTHKVTADPNHPFPWRWWFTVDTPLGTCTDEGMARSEADAVQEAGDFLDRWIADQLEAKATAGMTTIDVVFPEEGLDV